MKLISTLVVALSIVVPPSAGVLAQEQRNAPPEGQNNNSQSSGSNVSGSTEITAWSRDASMGGTTDSGSSAADQPLTASGLDLDGPPVRFGSGEAPE